MKICKKIEFPAIKNWDKYSHLLEKKISWFSLINLWRIDQTFRVDNSIASDNRVRILSPAIFVKNVFIDSWKGTETIEIGTQKDAHIRGAAIAQLIRLRLPSCRPGFNSKHPIYAFLFIVKFLLYLSM